MHLREINPDIGHTTGLSTASKHRVQFYNDDDYLVTAVTEHLASSLVCDGVALAFATETHRRQIYERLAQADFPAELVEKHCLVIEASEGLARFMRNGAPDRQLFRSMLDHLLGTQNLSLSDHAGIAAFGEMVAVLWAEGNQEAAIQLEQLWTEFTESRPISLLCAYPLAYFSRADDRTLFAQVCAHHSSVIPAESFVSGIMEDDQAREIAELQQRAEALAKEVEARKRAEEHLRMNQAELETTVQQRTAALRKLSLQVLKLQDIERRRVARELHESVGQDFAGLKMHLDLAKRSPHDAQVWEKCDELLEHCIQEVRTLSNLLHPPIIEDAGLPSASEWYVKDFAKRSRIQVHSIGLQALSGLSDSARLVVFRALQETLVNVYRHAQASSAQVSAKREGNHILLRVADDGRGIPSERVAQFNNSGTGLGVGLTGIFERVRELGGGCTIHSSQQGTTVSISIPLS